MKRCPNCGYELGKDEDGYYCENRDCDYYDDNPFDCIEKERKGKSG